MQIGILVFSLDKLKQEKLVVVLVVSMTTFATASIVLYASLS